MDVNLDAVGICKFQREKFGKYEAGIFVESESGKVIVDAQGNVVEDFYNFGLALSFFVRVKFFIEQYQEILDNWENDWGNKGRNDNGLS